MLRNNIENREALKSESPKRSDSDAATMSLVRKMLDNFLASNDEDLAHELVKWMEWKMSGLNLTAEGCQQGQNRLNDNSSRSGSAEKLNEYTSTSGTAESARPESQPAGEPAPSNATYTTIPLDTVQRLSCKCGNSFLLRLSITGCPSQADASPLDDSSDAGDEHDNYEIGAGCDASAVFEPNVCGIVRRFDSRNKSVEKAGLTGGRCFREHQLSKAYEESVCAVDYDASAVAVRAGRLNKRKPVNPCRINSSENGGKMSNSASKEETIDCVRTRVLQAQQVKGSQGLLSSGSKEPEGKCDDDELKCHQLGTDECKANRCSCLSSSYNGCNCVDDACSAGAKKDGHCVVAGRYSAESGVSFDKPSGALALVVSSGGNGFAGAPSPNNSQGTNSFPPPHYSRYESDSSSPAAVEFVGADGKRQFRCPICFNNYANRSGLNRHYVTHSPDDLWKAECHICGKKYSRKDSLKHHIKTQHTMNNSIHGSGALSVSGGEMNRRSAQIETTIKPYPAKIAKLDVCDSVTAIATVSTAGQDICSNHGSKQQLPRSNGQWNSEKLFVCDGQERSATAMSSSCLSKDVVFAQLGSRQSPRTESH